MLEHEAEASRAWPAMRRAFTPELLIELARPNPDLCRRMIGSRPLVAHAFSADAKLLQRTLTQEEIAERERDTAYWKPLRRELEALRHRT